MLLLAFLGKKHAYFEIKEAVLGARHAAVKELLTDEHKLYCLTFAESNVDPSGTESYSLMNLHLAQHIMGRSSFIDLGENVTTVNICLPANAVVVCLFTIGLGLL